MRRRPWCLVCLVLAEERMMLQHPLEVGASGWIGLYGARVCLFRISVFMHEEVWLFVRETLGNGDAMKANKGFVIMSM